MFKKLSLILFLLSTFKLAGQDNSTDSLQHYLILQSKGNHKYSVVFRENKKMEVHNKQGEYFKGKMFVLNDSTIEIVNFHFSEIDTISISNISKIRYVGLANKIIAFPSLLAGGGFLLLGGGIYTAAGNYDPIGSAVGTAFMVISTPFIALSAILFHGKSYKMSKHDIKVYHSKIRNLKRKQSKHFYPNT
jgi:hypothetical protein